MLAKPIGRMDMATFRDVVIFLPGIGGSSLQQDGRVVWGGSWSAIADAILRHSLDNLTLAQETGQDDLNDGIVVGGILDALHMIPGLWKIDAYGAFCRQLSVTVGLTPGQNFFTYPYDWRRDNRVSARRLKTFAETRLDEWRRRSGAADARLILIAHSMGGLVARYYIECLEGWKFLRRLLTIGTPHLGSVDALGYLVNGYAKKIGPISVDATAPMRSFSSVYQLLPVFRCVEAGGTLNHITADLFPQLDNVRLKDAREFHDEISNGEAKNRDLSGYPHNYLTAIVSSRQPTFQSARPSSGRLELLRSIEDEDQGGDGTVPAISATPFNYDVTAAYYVWGLHSALMNQQPVQESLIHALRAVSSNRERFRHSGEMAEVTLSMQDVYEADEEFLISAGVRGAVEQLLMVEVVRLEDGLVVNTTLHKSGEAFIGPLTLEKGTWRVHVAGRNVQPATEYIMAVEPGSASLAIEAR